MALQVAIQEVRRLQKFGVSADELEVYKAALLRDSQQMAEGVSNILLKICCCCCFSPAANCTLLEPFLFAGRAKKIQKINAAWLRVHCRQYCRIELVRPPSHLAKRLSHLTLHG